MTLRKDTAGLGSEEGAEPVAVWMVSVSSQRDREAKAGRRTESTNSHCYISKTKTSNFPHETIIMSHVKGNYRLQTAQF